MNPQLAQGEFYGQTLKNHTAARFSLSETRYVPGSKLAAHSHESPYFGFILRGTYTGSIKGADDLDALTQTNLFSVLNLARET